MISAIVVSYKTPAELAAAMASLKAQTHRPDEMIVIDNAAPDGDPLPDWISQNGSRVTQPPTNLGFGAGCNLGAAQAEGDYLLFMNADVVLTAKAIGLMLERFERNPQIGAVGPRVLSGGEVQASARAFPNIRTGLLGRRSPITRLLGRLRRHPAELRHSYGSGGPVDWVSGACMIIRRSAFDAVGGFDERYWMYWEDADLCRRLAAAGWEVHYEPRAVVHHATHASGTSERTIRAFHASAARYASRHVARGPVAQQVIEQLLEARCWIALRSYSHARRGAHR